LGGVFEIILLNGLFQCENERAALDGILVFTSDFV